MDVNAANNTHSSAAATKPKAPQTSVETSSKSALSSDFETFLRMLTTQMENQDPLNPMQSTEFATQLATFSSVEQQTKSNDLLAAMASQLSLMSMTQITGWVGMEARTAEPVAVDGGAVEFTPEPASAADRMAVVVRNTDGAEVGRLEMAASDDPFAWTPTGRDGGPLAAGTYSFELESRSDGQVLQTGPLETYARVVEVRNEAGEAVVVLQGGATVAPASVTALRQPAA